VLGIWSLASATGHLDPRTVPAPWTVVDTGWDLWVNGTLGTDVATSAKRTMWGFLIGLTAGVVLALVAGLSRAGEALIDGTVQLNRSVPVLDLIPLFSLWLGIGETFKVSIIAIVVCIPIYINFCAGLAGIDARYVELAETLRLSRTACSRRWGCRTTSPGVVGDAVLPPQPAGGGR
jgi:sulfonate transport system permease protein